MVRQVQPLRISKNTPSSTPNGKMATSRPLSEIGSTERRRNSPSYNQATRVRSRSPLRLLRCFTDSNRSQKMIVSNDASPYTENSSPPSFLKGSPRDFWSGRDAMSPSRFDEESEAAVRSPSPSLASPQRRSSIEKLKQASRVRNSNIFALESKDAYDPSSLPIVERPSANRPLSQNFANNSFTRFDSLRKENNPLQSPKRSGHRRTETETNVPLVSPTKFAASVPLPFSPDKQGSPSPTKSSLSRTSQFGASPPNSFDPENGAWSDDEARVPTPRALHRHAKSVTFHEEPPVINEYEQQTPEPSVSVASEDREGSWDSEDFEDADLSFERGSSVNDSFDADLENADKTPVVLPEDWSRMSPDEARMDLVDAKDDVFDGNQEEEEGEEEATQRLAIFGQSSDTRVASDGSESSRPLPPLPGFMRRDRRDSNELLVSAAERAAHSPRNLPSPPKRASCSKDEILQMTARSSLTLQDRLQLMGGHEDRPSSKSSQDTQTQEHHSAAEELTITNLDTGEKVGFQVKETEVEEDSVLDGDVSAIDDAPPPRISRESILRNVRNAKFDFEEDEDYIVDESVYQGDSDRRPTIEELARLDPDQAVPSRECSAEKTGYDYEDATEVAYSHTAEMDDIRDALAYAEEHTEEVKIKDEPADEPAGFDMSTIPEARDPPVRSPSRMDDYERQGSVLRHDVEASMSDDSGSIYSSVEPDAESTMIRTTRQETVEYEDGTKETLQEAMELLSVKEYGQSREIEEPTKPKQGSAEFMGLPAYLSTDDYDFGMKEYITPSPPAESNRNPERLDTISMPSLQPPAEFQEPHAAPDVSPPGTPDSVIYNNDDGSAVSPIEEHCGLPQQEERRESDGVPERIASIKTGGKLKTRKSATQADLETMAEQRRMVSAELPNMPAIPKEYQAEIENAHAGAEPEEGRPESPQSATSTREKPDKARRKSRKSGGRMDFDIGLDTSTFSIGDHDGLGLEDEFERVIEGQKVGVAFPPPRFARFDAGTAAANAAPQRYIHHDYSPSPFHPHTYSSVGTDFSTRTQKGYLTRQNTKVVVASNRNFSGESNETAKLKEQEAPMSPTAAAQPKSKYFKGKESPRKTSEEQFLKTEPWNGKTRRKSIRNASAQKQAYKSEPAPPLPGQESALGVVDEDYAAGSGSLEDEVAEGVERGRLFVKVVGVKDLDLPMPRNDRIDFQLMLDNGLHCVTTTSLELGRAAPIGQEFELVVLNDLEFQLTLTTKLPPPPSTSTPAPSSPTKSLKGQKSSHAFSRFLSSPKKRAEKERLEREAAEAEERRQQAELRRKRASQIPTAWDLLHDLVNASDGSFARAYVNLKSHERACFGRPVTVDVPCYNEWALEQDTQVVHSVRSKRGTNSGPVRRPPYVVGQLELQLLYVPKPKRAGEEDMPKSMSGAIRAMNRASETVEVVFEGCLSQQGGDCVVSSTRWLGLP